LFLHLNGFQYQVFLDFKQVWDTDTGIYSYLCQRLQGQGVSSINDALSDLLLNPVHNAFREFFNSHVLQNYVFSAKDDTDADAKAGLSKLPGQIDQFLIQIKEYIGTESDIEKISQKMINRLLSLRDPEQLLSSAQMANKKGKPAVGRFMDEIVSDKYLFGAVMFAWTLTRDLGELYGKKASSLQGMQLFDELKLGREIENAFRDAGLPGHEAWLAVRLVRVLILHQNWRHALTPVESRNVDIITDLLKSTEIRTFLGVNVYQGVEYFNKEAFGSLVKYLFMVGILDLLEGSDPAADAILKELDILYEMILTWQHGEELSEYEIDKFLKAVKTSS